MDFLKFIVHIPENLLHKVQIMYIELNAHALISAIHNKDEAFLTWLLGYQTCEKQVHLARTMTMTIINFSMLELLRLHRLQLQSQLQAEYITKYCSSI